MSIRDVALKTTREQWIIVTGCEKESVRSVLPVLYIDLQPGQTCHSRVMHRKEVTHSNGSYEKKSRRRAWLKKWDKVKIPWYTHRLMHRKRVTCELHHSYFRLMTIKHAIPKIEWAIELLYNSVETGSQESWR